MEDFVMGQRHGRKEASMQIVVVGSGIAGMSADIQAADRAAMLYWFPLIRQNVHSR